MDSKTFCYGVAFHPFQSPNICIKQYRACICNLLKEPRNRFPAWRNQFLGSLKVYKYGLTAVCGGDEVESCRSVLRHSLYVRGFRFEAYVSSTQRKQTIYGWGASNRHTNAADSICHKCIPRV
jgi:hypothetical protein